MTRKTSGRDKLKKNRDLIHAQFESVINGSTDVIKDKISGKFTGILGRVMKKVVGEMLDWAMKTGARERGLKIFIYLADQAVLAAQGDLEKVVDEGFEGYLENHEFYRMSHKEHPKIGALRELLKDEFRKRLRIYARVIQGDGETYNELLLSSVTDRDEMMKLVDDQFRASEAVLKMVDGEKGLMVLPAPIRHTAMKVVFAGFRMAEEKIKKETVALYACRS
jgi:hypothetical protein